MRRILILLAALAIGFAAQADAHGKRGKRGPRQHKARIVEALELTDEQVAQVEALKEQKIEERQAAREERKAAFEAILSEAQLAALNEYRETREPGQHKRGERPDLGLTEEQLTELASLREQSKEAVTAMREEFKAAFEAILAPEQLAILEEIKANHRSHRDGKTGDEADDTGSAADVSTALQFDIGIDGAPTVIEESSWGALKELMAP